MNTNEVIQLLAVIYFVLGLAFIFNEKYYLTLFTELLKSKIFLFIWWYIALILGFIIVLFFHTYTFSKEWFVSVIWLIPLFKWIMLLVFPWSFKKANKLITKKKVFEKLWFIIIFISFWLIYLWFLS